MKKSVIITIAIIYILAIVIVGFLGIALKIYDEHKYVESIKCITEGYQDGQIEGANCDGYIIVKYKNNTENKILLKCQAEPADATNTKLKLQVDVKKGYDYNNPAENRSGMRANYYFDYYGGGSTSPLGGTNWDLMKSTDYFDLYKTSGLYDSQCARVKHNRGAAMRYINYNLYDGSATAITNGGSLVFFAKGSDTEDVKIKIRAYMVNKVDKNNQITAGTVSTLFDDVTIHQNSGNYAGWQKYEFQLAANKTYYGFSITTIHNNGSGATYFYLDNIYVYSSVNPF